MDPGREIAFWWPRPKALLALGFRANADVPALKELEDWFYGQRLEAEALAKGRPGRRRERERERRASVQSAFACRPVSSPRSIATASRRWARCTANDSPQLPNIIPSPRLALILPTDPRVTLILPTSPRTALILPTSPRRPEALA